jgi:hypothetical protein
VRGYDKYLPQYREQLKAILTKDREREGRGLQAVGAIPKGIGEAAGVSGVGGPVRRAELSIGARPEGEEGVAKSLGI